MNQRIEIQERLRLIAEGIDPAAEVEYVFDDGVFMVMAPDRRDVPLTENFIADRSDGQVRDAIRLSWGIN